MTFQPSSEIQCVLLKNFRLASLEFSSCSVYHMIFVAPFRVFFINVSKQLKVEICELYHKSHHSVMVLCGSALPHKIVSNRSAQRDMNEAPQGLWGTRELAIFIHGNKGTSRIFNGDQGNIRNCIRGAGNILELQVKNISLLKNTEPHSPSYPSYQFFIVHA